MGEINIDVKRNTDWDTPVCRANKMLNYMMMRYLLGRKQKFKSPFVEEGESSTLTRTKLDRIINQMRSYITVDDAIKWSERLDMDIDIFSGNKHFMIKESKDYPMLNDTNWKKFITYKKRINAVNPNFTGDEEEVTFNFVNDFKGDIKAYLNDELKKDIANIEDEQLRRFIFYIKKGVKYRDDTAFKKYDDLIQCMKGFSLNDMRKLNDSSLLEYKKELYHQIEKVNAILVCREEGILMEK
jgi:hypothetical protein